LIYGRNLREQESCRCLFGAFFVRRFTPSRPNRDEQKKSATAHARHQILPDSHWALETAKAYGLAGNLADANRRSTRRHAVTDHLKITSPSGKLVRSYRQMYPEISVPSVLRHHQLLIAGGMLNASAYSKLSESVSRHPGLFNTHQNQGSTV
jgi:hypothetical protein